MGSDGHAKETKEAGGKVPALPSHAHVLQMGRSTRWHFGTCERAPAYVGPAALPKVLVSERRSLGASGNFNVATVPYNRLSPRLFHALFASWHEYVRRYPSHAAGFCSVSAFRVLRMCFSALQLFNCTTIT